MKVNEEKILILKDFPMAGIASAVQGGSGRFGLKKTLFVLVEASPVLEKSSRNLRDVKMMRSEGINVYDLLKYDHLVLMEPSIKMIEEALSA